jgi:cellulose synthase operon protein C
MTRPSRVSSPKPRFIHYWGWLLGLSLMGAALPAQASDLQTGNSLVQQGLVQQALPYLQRAVSQNPQSVEALLGLARAYMKAGGVRNDQLAFDTFKKAVQLDPNNKEALYAVGLMGEYKYEWRNEAIGALNKLIELEPSNMQARAQRALLNGYIGNLKEAIADYDVVIPTNPEAKVLLAAAQSYTFAAEYEKAIDLFGRYAATGGKIEQYAALAYGVALRETGDPAKSVEILNQALANTPKLDGVAIRARAALAVSYAQLDQMDQAMEVVVPLRDRFDSRMILARTYHQINQDIGSNEIQNEVIDIYYKVLDAPLPPGYKSPRPGDPKNFYLTLAIAHEMADVLSGIPPERQLARDLYVQLLKQLPDNRIMPVSLAIVEQQLGLISRAELKQRMQPYVLPIPASNYDRRLLAQALVRLDSPDPSLLPFYQPFVDAQVDEPLLWFRIAQMQIQDNNLVAAKAAVASYQATKAGQRDPYGPLLLLAEIDRRENNLDASVAKYEQIIAAPKVTPSIRSGALQALAGIYRIQGDLPEAIALYDQIIARYPDDLAKPLGRASLAYQAGQISEAEAEAILNQWLTTRPVNDLPLELYSLVAALPADERKGELYERLLSANPESVPIRLRSLQLMALTDPEGAKTKLADMIANDPDNLGSYFIQGEFAQDLGDLDLASEAYETILARSANNTDALAALGGVRFQQRQYAEAADLYTEVLNLEPGNQIAQTAIIELNAAQGNRLEAIEQIEEMQEDSAEPNPRMERRRQRIESEFLQQRGFQPPWERY